MLHLLRRRLCVWRCKSCRRTARAKAESYRLRAARGRTTAQETFNHIDGLLERVHR